MQLSEAYLKKQQEWKTEEIQQGIQQTLPAIDLLRQEMSNESVARSTGFSIEEVEETRQRQNN